MRASTGLIRSECARPARRANKGETGTDEKEPPGLRKGGSERNKRANLRRAMSIGEVECVSALFWESRGCVCVRVCVRTVDGECGVRGGEETGAGDESSAGAGALCYQMRGPEPSFRGRFVLFQVTGAGGGRGGGRAGAKPASDARRAAPQNTPPPGPSKPARPGSGKRNRSVVRPAGLSILF